MSPRRPKNVVAITPGGAITQDMILGYITMFHIPEQPVSAAKLNRLWMGEGLPPDLIPRTRKSVNAFQVACRSVETRRKGEATNKGTEITVDPVMETPDKCVYQVTSIVRDKANELVEHPKALRVTFEKVSEVITWQPLDQLFDTEQVDGIGAAIRDYYDANAKKVPAARVREAVRKLMDHLDATNMRRKAGGVYMVPREGAGDLDALSTVFSELWSGEAEINRIPLCNGEAERELVERHLDITMSDEIDELMVTVREGLTKSNRSMRQDAIGNLLARRKVLGTRHGRYQGLLDSNLGEVETKLELLDDQLQALVLAKGSDE